MTVVPLFCAKFITIDPGTSIIASRQLEEDLEPAQRARRGSYGSSASSSTSSIWRSDELADMVREAIASCAESPGVCCDRASVLVVLVQLCSVSISRKSILPANGSRPVRRECQSTGRHANRGNRRLYREDGTGHPSVVSPEDLNMIVSNIGITPDLSAIYTSNSGMHTAFIQVSLKEDHKTGSYAYMQKRTRETEPGFSRCGHILPGWRLGGLGGQPGKARSNRHSDRRQRSAAGL